MTDRPRSDEHGPEPVAPESGARADAADGGLDSEIIEAEIVDAEPSTGETEGADEEAARAGAEAVDAEVVEAEVVDRGRTGEPVTSDAPGGDQPDGGRPAGAEPGGGGEPDGGSEPGGAGERGRAGTPDDDLDAAAAAVEVDLELLRAEREQFLSAYQRAQADFENFRKQAHKRQEDALQRALGGFVHNLLPVLDACDAAMAHGAGEAVEPIVTALQTVLEKEGLERIDPVGEPFDPTEAEAVVHEPGSGGEQVVAEVMRAGYRWRGRVLRPAMVKVTD